MKMINSYQKENNLDICFIFDNKMIEIAKVAISSLLFVSCNKNHYNIHCIVPLSLKKEKKRMQNFIKKRDKDSILSFYYIPPIFSSWTVSRHLSSICYAKLFLHVFFPNLKKIIYSDVDVIYYRNPSDIWKINIEKYAIAGVKARYNLDILWEEYEQEFYFWHRDTKNIRKNYINTGVLIMNLEKMRDINIPYEDIMGFCKKYHYFHDQAAFNFFYAGFITHIPPKYNYTGLKNFKNRDLLFSEKIYTPKEVKEAEFDFVIRHYTGEKPWNNPKIEGAKFWFDFILNDNDLFKKFKKNNKVISLFDYREYTGYRDIQLFDLFSDHYIKKIPFLTKMFCQSLGYYPNFYRPKTLSEKINWYKLFFDVPLGHQYADKYNVREYVIHTIGEKYLVPLLGIWKHPDEIDFLKLPQKFILKTNYGSGQNILCSHRANFNIFKARQDLRRYYFPYRNFYYRGFQTVYKNIPFKILAEQYIEDLVCDLKIFCNKGKPFLCEVRHVKEGSMSFYNLKAQKLPFGATYPPDAKDFPITLSGFKKVLGLAKKLAQPFPFIRVDFLFSKNSIYFSELTFFHSNGFLNFYPNKGYDAYLGNLLTFVKYKKRRDVLCTSILSFLLSMKYYLYKFLSKLSCLSENKKNILSLMDKRKKLIKDSKKIILEL